MGTMEEDLFDIILKEEVRHEDNRGKGTETDPYHG